MLFKNNVFAIVLLTIFYAGLYSVSTYAATYKWIDQNNKVNYSSVPPSTGSYTVVPPPPGPSSSAAQEIQQEKKQEQMRAEQAQKNKDNQATIDAQKKAAAIAAENCDVAKNKLQTLTYTPRVRQLNPRTGEFEVLSPQDLDKAIEKAQKEVEQYCGRKLPS